MTPYLSDAWLQVYQGDCQAVMAELPPASVHCVVTSPPYWGLRDYGTASWEGGDLECDHRIEFQPRADRPQGLLHGGFATVDAQDTGARVRHRCPRCGAVRVDGQLGLEATPEVYVERMVEVFRSIARVLRPDGTVWLNLGDSYASHDPGGYREGEFLNPDGRPPIKGQARNRAGSYRPGGLKPKDLVGIPWRVAFALQADGWYLRSDVIWSKPNPMPESVRDRPSSSHEHVFLLARSRRYYYDAEAVREPVAEATLARIGQPTFDDQTGGEKDGLNPNRSRRKALVNLRYKFDVAKAAMGSDIASPNRIWDDPAALARMAAGRSLRDVWTIATEPYRGAHFATFPQKLVEPCIRASTSERGVCGLCGAPWARRASVTYRTIGSGRGNEKTLTDAARAGQQAPGPQGMRYGRAEKHVQTLAWQPTCGHDGDPVPATVLDPFAGSGTVGLVAQELYRRAVLIDLSVDYLDQAIERNRDISLWTDGLGA